MKNKENLDPVFVSLKATLIGRIDDEDIKLIKEGFKRLKTANIYNFDIYKDDFVHIFHYMWHLDEDSWDNRFFIKLRDTLYNAKCYVFGTTTFITQYKTEYFKYFRFYPEYNVLELVSDYYKKIPIFYHFSKLPPKYEDELFDTIGADIKVIE